MSQVPNERIPNERRLMDEVQRWLRIPERELDDDIHDDDSGELDDLVKRLRQRDPVGPTPSQPPATAPPEPWHERVLRGLLTFMAGMLLFGILAGGVALLGLPLLEDVNREVACDTLVWYAYRQSLAHSLVAFSGGILGVSLLVALPALAGREHRGLRWCLSVLATVLLVTAIASGEKERTLRTTLKTFTTAMATNQGTWDPDAKQQCLERFKTNEVRMW